MRLGKDVLEADLYAALGILPDATASEIRVAYRRRARESHPDLNQLDPQAVPRMARLNVAARVLLDPALRKLYEQARRHRAEPSAKSGPPRQTEWFERSEQGLDDDWVEPPSTASQRPETPRFGGFLTELRSRKGRLSLQLDGRIRSLTARQQVTVAALLLTVAVGLIAMARPHSLGGGRPGSSQPSSVSAAMLFP